jgi:protein ImuB
MEKKVMSSAGSWNGTARRVASVWFPSFATDRLCRKNAAWRANPLATVSDGNVQRIAAVNTPAQANGIAPGMTLADARALVPQLAVLPADPAGDARTLGRLADWCIRYTPWVSVDREDQCGSAGLWLDITGCAHLLGGEAELIGDLETRLGALGFAARAAVADTSGAAWAWARFAAIASPEDAVIPPGEQRTALAGLPAAGLRLGPETGTMLQSLGLRRIGDLYRFTRTSLPVRFGALLLRRLDQALDGGEPLSPRQPPVACRAVLNFAEPILEAASISAATHRLLHDLSGQLASRAQGSRRFALTAYRSDGTTNSLAIGTGTPTRDAAHLVRLFAERLERIAPGCGIDAMTLAAATTEPLGAQQAQLADRQSMTVDLTQLFDVLGTRLGHAQVMRLAAQASHVPERAVRRIPAAAQPAPAALPETPRPLRLFPRPEPIEASALLPDEPPFQFIWRGIVHRVVRAQGPERIAGEWWRDRGPTRDYYQVEDTDGRRFWLYRDHIYQPQATRWFLHGLFG